MEQARVGIRAYRGGFILIAAFLLVALILPVCAVLWQSFLGKNGEVGLQNWAKVLSDPEFFALLGRSFLVAGLSAFLSAVIAFFAAYGLTFTNINGRLKKGVQIVLLLPLFLPSITYGFAVMYSFGRMGLVSQLIGQPPFSIYGFAGLLIANVVYTLPPAFLILYNAFAYVDRRFVVVSRVMGDGLLRSFYQTALRPTLGAFVSAFVLAFFLAFTDFGIPVSIAGQYNVIATELYAVMMGAIPNFGEGAVLAISMVIPAAFAVWVLKRSDRLNFRYSQISKAAPLENKTRDRAFLVYFGFLTLVLVAIFAVMFIVPFVENWPYKPNFTMRHVEEILGDPSLWSVYLRSVMVAIISAAIGTAITFAAGMIKARSALSPAARTTMDAFAMVTNTLPGMVIGVGYLFVFSGTPLQNTLAIIIMANVVHFFATPYLMSTAALSKMNAGWETTGLLMGDTWWRTVRRVVIPNALPTLYQMFETYFINAMVTISAVVFLCGTRTMLVTTRIKELQYFEKFDAIFVLSLLIFFTNVAAKLLFDRLAEGKTVGKPRAPEIFSGAAGRPSAATP